MATVHWDGEAGAEASSRAAIVEASGVLAFWDHPDEDVYTMADGDPV